MNHFHVFSEKVPESIVVAQYALPIGFKERLLTIDDPLCIRPVMNVGK